MSRIVERSGETKQQGIDFYLKSKDAYLSFKVASLSQMRCPEDFTEVVFPVDYDEGIIEETKRILEEFSGIECGVFPGYIKYNYLPPNWVVPVQIVRAFIPKDPINRTGLAMELYNAGIAFNSRERIIFTASKRLLTKKPEFK